MSTVLVHNNAHVSKAEAWESNRKKSDVEGLPYWNIWKQAPPPFHLIEDGSDILLLESWPSGGLISWHVRAERVITARVADKADAVRRISRQTGWTRREILSNPYTRDRPDEASVLILGGQSRPAP